MWRGALSAGDDTSTPGLPKRRAMSVRVYLPDISLWINSGIAVSRSTESKALSDRAESDESETGPAGFGVRLDESEMGADGVWERFVSRATGVVGRFLAERQMSQVPHGAESVWPK